MNNLLKKLKESSISVLPIAVMVTVLFFLVDCISLYTFLAFLTGTVLLVLGMTLFSLGADMAMLPMGEEIGSKLIIRKKMPLIMAVCFFLGVIVTAAEPDLAVLARQVPNIPDAVIIITVSLGVGIFLAIALLRIFFKLNLSVLLMICYAIVFILAIFVSDEFLPLSLDSGGVTTGPMTVPFIMALGIGLSAVRGGKTSAEDSFGLVALCSVGPIIAVLILGLFYPASYSSSNNETIFYSYKDVLTSLIGAFPEYLKEMAIALFPLTAFFLLFNFISLKLPASKLIKLAAGIVYTFIGLAIFLTAANVAFMPMGTALGKTLAESDYKYLIIPLGLIIGAFTVIAEPAVRVLNKQVEEISNGVITRRSMMIFTCVGVAVSVCLSMIRALFSISIWFFVLPGYIIAFILSFIVPKIFTGIAFDSGGVASGPLTATFILPFAMGVVSSIGGNILTDAFGAVALVAMTPLITIQILGLVYKIRCRKYSPQQPLYDFSGEGSDIIEFDLSGENVYEE